MKRLIPSFVGFVLVFAGAPVASAEPPPTPAESPSADDLDRARELFDNGKQLYLGGSYDAAIVAFKDAYELSGDRNLLYNIAEAHDRAGNFDGAIEYLEYYRAVAPAAERDALAEKVDSLRRRKLKQQAEETPEATQDDEPPGPGNERNISRASGPTEPADSSSERTKIYGPAAIALTAVTGAALGVAIGLGVASRSRQSDVDDACVGDPMLCPESAAADVTAARRFAIGSDVSFGIAAAAAVAVITIVAVNATKKQRQRRAGTTAARTRVMFGAGPRGSVSLRF